MKDGKKKTEFPFNMLNQGKEDLQEETKVVLSQMQLLQPMWWVGRWIKGEIDKIPLSQVRQNVKEMEIKKCAP